MKKINILILAFTITFQTNIHADDSLFDLLVKTVQTHPKYTIVSALIGCIASAGLTYHRTLPDRLLAQQFRDEQDTNETNKQIVELFQQNSALIFFTNDVSEQLEQTPLLRTYDLINQKECHPCDFFVMQYVPDEDNPEYTSDDSYVALFIDEEERPFPTILYPQNSQLYQDNTTLEAKLAKARNEGYENGKKDSTSGKLKQKAKKALT